MPGTEPRRVAERRDEPLQCAVLAHSQRARRHAQPFGELVGVDIMRIQLLEQRAVPCPERFERISNRAAPLLVDEIGEGMPEVFRFSALAPVAFERPAFPTAFAQPLQADVARSLKHEARKRGRLAQPVFPERLCDSPHRLLGQVLGVRAIAEPAHTEHEETRVKAVPERCRVDAGRGRYACFFGCGLIYLVHGMLV